MSATVTGLLSWPPEAWFTDFKNYGMTFTAATFSTADYNGFLGPFNNCGMNLTAAAFSTAVFKSLLGALDIYDMAFTVATSSEGNRRPLRRLKVAKEPSNVRL